MKRYTAFGRRGARMPRAGGIRSWGYYKPFTIESLDALYPNRGQYVSKVIQVTNENVNHGYLLDGDAKVTIEAAYQTSVGMR